VTQRGGDLLQTGSLSIGRLPVDLERYFNQQNIARYRKLLELVSDQTQRRQIMNLLEEEEYELARYSDAPTLAPIMKL
jgi:hypothetical protein